MLVNENENAHSFGLYLWAEHFGIFLVHPIGKELQKLLPLMIIISLILYE